MQALPQQDMALADQVTPTSLLEMHCGFAVAGTPSVCASQVPIIGGNLSAVWAAGVLNGVNQYVQCISFPFHAKGLAHAEESVHANG